MAEELRETDDDRLAVPRVQCTRLGSVLDLNDPDFWTLACHSPMPERSRLASARSKSLPGSVTLGLPPLPASGSTRLGLPPSTGSQKNIRSEVIKDDRNEIRLLVIGYSDVGKSGKSPIHNYQ